MAASYSSESDVDSEYYVKNDGNIQPYDYQPRKRPALEKDVLDSSSSSSDSEKSEHREGNNEWCLCGKCNYTLLVRDKEHICCRERAKTRSRAEMCNEGT